jgi:arylsulfatase A-like enzyme
VPSIIQILGGGPSAPGRSTLAERLAQHGYATACFTDNPHLYSGSPILRGFDLVGRSVGRWRTPIGHTIVGEVVERLHPGLDADLVRKALAWASRRRGPFFLYVHLMDSHTPYRFPPIDGRRQRGRRIEFPVTGMRVTAAEAADVVARYDGGVRSADVQLDRLVRSMQESRRPFLAVITADHGESLGESDRWFHGQTLAPELLAVPLVVLGEGVVPAGVEAPVSNTAIVPTLLAAAGMPCPECVSYDLRSTKGTGVVEGGLPPQLAYRIAGGYKLVLNLETGRRQLFDLTADPAERHDLAPERPSTAAAMSVGLSGVPWSAPPADSVERLRALGYAGS